MFNKTKLKAVARQKGNFKAQGNEIMLYGTIGDWWDDLEAQKIVNTIQSMSGDITVRINSQGGDVFDGIAIMNALKNHDGLVKIVIDALAASIASVIAMAGDEIIMSEGSFLMIHNPYTIAMGDSAEMRKMAEILDQMTDNLAGIYSRKTGIEIEEIKTMMESETWIDADFAIDNGFATKTDEPAQGFENLDLSVFNNVPNSLKIAANGCKPNSIRDIEKILHNNGLSRAEAKRVASGGFGALDQREVEKEDYSEKLLAAVITRNKIIKRK